MKKNLLAFAFLLFTFYQSFSQIDMGLPSATGKGGAAGAVLYDWECIGINPANLGWEKNHRFSLSTMIFGISAQSKALDYGQLKKAITHPTDTFSKADKKIFADLFTDKDGLNLQLNTNWLTFSFAIPKVGGFAMNVRDRTFGHVRLNQNAADIVFMGMNAPIFQDTMAFFDSLSTIFDGCKIGYTHYRELNLAYGVKFFGIGGTKDSSKVSVYAGVGFKYLWGLGDLEMTANNNILTGHSSFSSKYGINYGNIKNFTPESTPGLFSSVGNGTAFDLGMGIGIGKVKITFSAVDMGKITWDKNVLIANNTLLDTMYFNGINSWNITQQANQMFSDSGIIEFKPGPSYSTELPSKLRFGIGYQITKRIIAGADVVTPMSDNPTNLERAFYAVGTEIEVASNLRFAFGFSGNSTYGFSLPMGITLARFFKIMEVSVATNDILTYFSHGSNPNISLSVCLFRINVPKKKK